MANDAVPVDFSGTDFPAQIVEQAAREIPQLLADQQGDTVTAEELVGNLHRRGHARKVARAAIDCLLRAKLLGSEEVPLVIGVGNKRRRNPMSLHSRDVERWLPGEIHEIPAGIAHVIQAEKTLWEWWKQTENAIPRDRLQAIGKPAAGPSPDESAFVAAKTLREQRGMTAARCSKFIKKYGTDSAVFLEGAVRFRKPNRKALEIHSADWLKFWQDIDRRQSDALDEDSMQEFLANAEAEKAKVKAHRKLSGASSRQVP